MATCGHPTTSGACSRTVPGEDDRCFMHNGGGTPPGHGAPTGNNNALGNSGGGAPTGNTNAEKYGSWNDPLKEYERLEGETKEYVDKLYDSIVERSKADLPPRKLKRKARQLAVIMCQCNRGWAHVFLDDDEDLAVLRYCDLDNGETALRWEINPAIKADSRNSSKQRKLNRELRTYPSPDGRPCSEH